jgi:copper chaperone CopZ
MIRTYRVPGISCDHCRQTIESGLRPLGGVIGVTVDVTDKTVRVEGTAEDSAVRRQLEDLGYPTSS